MLVSGRTHASGISRSSVGAHYSKPIEGSGMKTVKIFVVASLALAVFGGAICPQEPDRPALRDAYKSKFLVGAALNDDLVSGRDPDAAAIVTTQFNSATAENAMKWVWIHPGPERYDFGQADRFVDFGEKHGMFIIGHTLVWHSQIPDWTFKDSAGRFLNREAMLERMKSHILTVVGRYRGRVHAWDVVNEALTDEGGIRNSPWIQTIGEDFVAKAFEYAHQADPDAELYYNDYSLDKPPKRDACVNLVKDLKARGLRLDGVGIQGHWGMDYPTTEDLDAFITAIASLDVKVMVTEMDLNILPAAWDYEGADVSKRVELKKGLDPYVDGLPPEVEKKHTDRYVELFSILLRHPQISRVTFWGVTDRTSWLNNWPVRGRTSFPLLFGRDYQPKPAFYGVIGAAGKSR
jgi:endo-1,4-beta-xylanase